MIAIIAGTGNLPNQACKFLLKSKKDFFVISLFPEDNFDEIKKTAQNKPVIKQDFYKAKAILDLLKEKNTKKVLFIGKVDKQNLLKKIKLDFFAIKLLAKLATKSDTKIMDKIGAELEKHGIEIISQNEVLSDLFVKPGILTGKLEAELKDSVEFGLKTAKKMSKYDIGQTVVLKDKMILAIEAIEGTDSCIRRGIDLGKNNVIICKAANDNQNKKFDLPTIGVQTLRDIKPGEIKVIAWDASKTFISNKDAFVQKAKKLGITLVAV